MRTFASIFLVAVIACRAFAEDTLMDGGRSPNGKYEVRIAHNPDREPSDYTILLRAADSVRPLLSLDNIGGYLRYPSAIERCRALWHPSSAFVAITDQGTRHTQELYILEVSPAGAKRLDIPAYIQNALGRVGAVSVDGACVARAARWDGDDLIIQLSFTANQRHSYTCEIVLRVHHGEHAAPLLELKTVSKPNETEG